MNRLIVIMGVSGCGKTTIAKAVAQHYDWVFIEADDFHPPENVKKMSASIPLTDADRTGWVDAFCATITDRLVVSNVVLACSALTPFVRERVSNIIGAKIDWYFLDGTRAIILERMKKRQGHFMPPSLLDSQFDALTVPAGAIKIDSNRPVDKVIDDVCEKVSQTN